MAGQFLESMDLAAALDHSVESGNMPPAVVAGPGYFREGHKAWGWRNGHGPGELSEFFVHSLLPTLARELPVEPIAHLVAWDYTTYSAIETARRIPGQIRSITLLNPSPRMRFDWSIADAASDLSRRAPGFPIAIGVPPARDGFAWSYDNDQLVRSGLGKAGVHLVDFEVSDPNIVAAGEALGNAIASVAPLSHELDAAYIATHPVTEPAPSSGMDGNAKLAAWERELLEAACLLEPNEDGPTAPR